MRACCKRCGALALLASLVLLALAVGRLAVAPLGDAIAAGIAFAVPSPASATVRTPPVPGRAAAPVGADADAVDGVGEPADRSALMLARRAALRGSRRRPAGGDAWAAPADQRAEPLGEVLGRAAPSIRVPATAVQRALQRRDVGAVDATAPDGSPLGARLLGVGKYRVGLRDGDVVVAVAGARTTSVEAMVAAATRAVSGGASRIEGRVIRGNAPYDVVLEIPK